MMKLFSTLKNNFLDFFYPKICLGCHVILKQNEPFFCLSCWYSLAETNSHIHTNSWISNVLKGRLKTESVNSCFYYKKQTKVQQLLWHLKYKNRPEIGTFVGEFYGQKLIESGIYNTVDVIIPIPIHPKKFRKRGYNQSEAFAEGLSRALNIPYQTQYLTCRTATSSQTKKTRWQRWQNVDDIFEVHCDQELENLHVLLCDDVLTTGATMESAGKKLLEIKGLKLSVVTLACAEG